MLASVLKAGGRREHKLRAPERPGALVVTTATTAGYTVGLLHYMSDTHAKCFPHVQFFFAVGEFSLCRCYPALEFW